MVRTGTGKRNPEVARTEVAEPNRQKMNIAKNRQMRRGQAVWITKVKKVSEISCKNIWPKAKCCLINRLKKYESKNVLLEKDETKSDFTP